MVRRSHGYVQLPESAIAHSQPSFLEEKERVARAAAGQIQMGMSSSLALAPPAPAWRGHLQGKRGLTIMTINLDVVQDILQLQDVKLSLLGGEVRVENGYIENAGRIYGAHPQAPLL